MNDVTDRLEQLRRMRASAKGSEKYLLVGVDVAKNNHHKKRGVTQEKGKGKPRKGGSEKGGKIFIIDKLPNLTKNRPISTWLTEAAFIHPP
jgi:hypothetical protein